MMIELFRVIEVSRVVEVTRVVEVVVKLYVPRRRKTKV